jgi:hypothetical protein
MGGFKYELQHGLTRRETPRAVSWIRHEKYKINENNF